MTTGVLKSAEQVSHHVVKCDDILSMQLQVEWLIMIFLQYRNIYPITIQYPLKFMNTLQKFT